MMQSLAIITARGGSKRIPHKNIRDFCGKPIIAYSIEAALESGLFDEVMVSTDSESIARVAQEYGATVPFMRSAATSDDFATTADVLREVLDRYEAEGKRPEWFCCLYPTAPFVTADELVGARKQMVESDAPAAVAVTEFDFPPLRGFSVSDDGKISYAFPEYASARSQDLPKMAHDCGRFYLCGTDAFLAAGTVVPDDSTGYMIDPVRVQDIDTPSDWEQAEFKWRCLNEA